MRSLLDFLVRHSYVFLFVLLETLSLILLFGFNDRQKEAFLTSAGSVSGIILEQRSRVERYFALGRENAILVEENAILRDLLIQATDSQYVKTATILSNQGTIAAHVIDNSVRKDNNYITIDKGRLDGIVQGMGVYNHQGIVGVVMAAGKRYSLVMPVLNGNTSISCKVKDSDTFGFLEWHGGDPYKALIVDMPYHSNVQTGDTIVTTGFSSVFPENLTVGVVGDVERSGNGYTLNIQVNLATDFSRLGWVFVNARMTDPEITELNTQIKD